MSGAPLRPKSLHHEAALSYAERGWPVFPLSPGRKEPLIARTAGGNGFHDATTDPRKIDEWWHDFPEANIGNPPSEREVVIDVDPRAGGDASLDELAHRLGPLPETVTTKTGGGGWHYRFLIPQGTDLPARLAPGVDLKGGGSGYVVLPPSLHESGRLYLWVPYCDPEEQTVAELPASWLGEINRLSGARAGGAGAPPLPGEIREGEGRNNALASLAGTMRRRGASEAAILAALRVDNQTRCKPSLDDEEVQGIAASVARYAPVHEPQVAARPSEVAGPPPETAAILSEVGHFIRRFVVLTPAQHVVTTLWVLHTWAIDAFSVTPFLIVSSAEKRSGKTRLIEVLELLVRRPWRAISPSEAVLYRKIERDSPTLLLDETDAIFSARSERYEALRGIINAIHRRGATVDRCIGKTGELQAFRVFCAIALAGIGRLPETIADRGPQIRVKRRARGESIERFHRREVDPAAKDLCGKLALWAAAHLEVLEQARPALPEKLDDRQADSAEPLLAISDLAGIEWSAKARAALVEVGTGEAAEDESLGVRLLWDIHRIFGLCGLDRLSSEELCGFLNEIEEAPWSEITKGRPLTKGGLAERLKPFEIRSGSIRRLDDKTKTARGYYRAAFEDAWSRFSNPQTDPSPEATGSDTVTQTNSHGPDPRVSQVTQTALCRQEDGENVNAEGPCVSVSAPASTGGVRDGGNGHSTQAGLWSGLRALVWPRAVSSTTEAPEEPREVWEP